MDLCWTQAFSKLEGKWTQASLTMQYIYIYIYILYIFFHRQWLLVIRTFSNTNLINKKYNLTVTILKINNFLIFAIVFQYVQISLKTFQNLFIDATLDFPLVIAFLSKVLKLWLENAPVPAYIWLYQEILKIQNHRIWLMECCLESVACRQ